jgi:hypothetical protein
LKIQYLQHNAINRVKWDRCINRSFNGIIYAFSWYLDIVSEDWEALVLGDYETVMPLTSKSKFGIYYLIQPIYSQQLGVFSTTKLNADLIEEFLKGIPNKFKFIDIKLNKYNSINDSQIRKTNLSTYEIDLIKPYEKSYARYSSNTKRNIKKALKNNVSIIKGLGVNEIIEFKKEAQKKPIHEKYYTAIRRIISFSILHKIGEIYGAYDDRNTLCAAAFFLGSHNKSIYLFAASNQKGTENSAMFLLIDHYIKKNSDKNVTLDFEGSMLPGLARFYGGFGAKECKFLNIRINNLAWPLKYLKN